MYDTVMDDLLEQIDQVTNQLADLNSGRGGRGTIRMRQGLLAQLSALNAQVYLRHKELYPAPVAWSARVAESWYTKAAAFAASMTLMVVFVGVFVTPWIQSVMTSLQVMARPVP